MLVTITMKNQATRKTGTKELSMTDVEILITVAVVAVIFAVKCWILTKI
jgi:hypothetical protein